jgi:adenylate cyclase
MTTSAEQTAQEPTGDYENNLEHSGTPAHLRPEIYRRANGNRAQANDGWKKHVVRRSNIRDGLIANNDGHKARVRIADDKATITLKSRRTGLVRTEFEYAIPCADAEEMLRTMCDGNVLNKVRHFVIHKDATWEVDVYEGILKGIVLAEIELTQPDQDLQFPDWVGAEVTGNARYRKVNRRAERLASVAGVGKASGEGG